LASGEVQFRQGRKGFFLSLSVQSIRHQLSPRRNRRRPTMRKFQESVKALEADIEHANAL
jgi:hypothetical protein